ncbi:MAG: nitrogenase component 1 [Elusimicrobiota bacterium]
MERIVFLGKGGIGKSTLAANVSATLALGGRRVLHIGCDPKHDSTLLLTGRPIVPFASEPGGLRSEDVARSIQPARLRNLDCIEAGGPRPGIGCAGLGISLMLDGLASAGLLSGGAYDAMVFDVLGDVVCGGFAAPMRKGFAEKAVIVASEEWLSLYAANNLLRMIVNCADNGVRLAGIVANVKDPKAAGPLLRFAERAGTGILAVLPRHPAITDGERRNRTVPEFSPGSALARLFERLVRRLMEPAPESLPAPLDPAVLARLGSRAVAAEPSPISRVSLPRALAAAGIELHEIRHDQIFCSMTHEGRSVPIVFLPADASRGGFKGSDWRVCFGPRHQRVSPALDSALEEASRRLRGFSFVRLANHLLGGSGLADVFRWQYGSGGKMDPFLSYDRWDKFFFDWNRRDSGDFPSETAVVEHGDIECRFDACTGGSLGHFAARGGTGAPESPFGTLSCVNTDMRRRDVLLGDLDRLESALRSLAAQKPAPAHIELYLCCTPLVMQTDLARLIGKIEAEYGVRIAVERYNNPQDRSTPGLKAESLARSLRSAGRSRREYAVNLLGFSENERRRLAPLLEGAGLSVAPFAESARERLANIRRSALQVLDVPLSPAHEKAFAAARVRWRHPGLPYGMRGTLRWLRGVKPAGRVAVPAPLRREFSGLARRAARFRLAFIVSAEELPFLEDPSRTSGVPLLAVVAEMGFRALICARKPADPGMKARLARLRAPVRFFSSKEELCRLLAAAHAVYSDVNVDRRLSAFGKPAFSSASFEMGFEGALAAQKRLLRLCTWDFYDGF